MSKCSNLKTAELAQRPQTAPPPQHPVTKRFARGRSRQSNSRRVSSRYGVYAGLLVSITRNRSAMNEPSTRVPLPDGFIPDT